MQNRIFSFDDNAKATKAAAFGWLNAIHYLAPAESGGVGNLCAHASPGCIALCLGWFSGHAAIGESNNVREFERDVRETALTLIEDRGETNALAWARHCATRDPSGGFWEAVRRWIENWDDPR